MNDIHCRNNSDHFLTQKKYKLVWLALIVIFLISGAVGHDPWWKKGETYSFGIIYHFYLTDTWLIPTNAGVPFMEKPPLYYWTAHLMCDFLGSILPLHDAARLASVLYTAIAAFFVWKTASILFRDRPGSDSIAYMTVALFLGNYGTAHFGHAMITDVALTTGASITLYGLSMLYMLPRQWKQAGIWIGIGFGVAFLSKGFVMPVVLAVSWLLIVFLVPGVKNKTNVRAIVLATAVAAPFFLLWPLLLYHHSPSLFMEWFWDNNVGRFFGFSVHKLGAENRRGNFLLMLPICSFPIFPLACVEVVLGRKEWKRPEYILPLVIALIGIAILFCSASFRTIYIMPLFPLFSILGVQGLMRLPEKFIIPWNKVVRVLFTLAIISTWIIWCNLRYSLPPHTLPWLATLFASILPPEFSLHEQQYVALTVASVLTVSWFVFLRAKYNSAFNTTFIFMLGVMAMWCTSHTLLLPWINEAKSYRTSVRELKDYVSKTSYSGKCIASYYLGENLGPMVQYFMKDDNIPIQVVTNLDTCTCPLALAEDPNVPMPKNWKQVWHNKELVLYEHVK